jgi:hypothetical protein
MASSATGQHTIALRLRDRDGLRRQQLEAEARAGHQIRIANFLIFATPDSDPPLTVRDACRTKKDRGKIRSVSLFPSKDSATL